MKIRNIFKKVKVEEPALPVELPQEFYDLVEDVNKINIKLKRVFRHLRVKDK